MFSFSCSTQVLTLQPSLFYPLGLPEAGQALGLALSSFLPLHCLFFPPWEKGVLPFGLFYLVHFRFPSGPPGVEGVGGTLSGLGQEREVLWAPAPPFS